MARKSRAEVEEAIKKDRWYRCRIMLRRPEFEDDLRSLRGRYQGTPLGTWEEDPTYLQFLDKWDLLYFPQELLRRDSCPNLGPGSVEYFESVLADKIAKEGGNSIFRSEKALKNCLPGHRRRVSYGKLDFQLKVSDLHKKGLANKEIAKQLNTPAVTTVKSALALAKEIIEAPLLSSSEWRRQHQATCAKCRDGLTPVCPEVVRRLKADIGKLRIRGPEWDDWRYVSVGDEPTRRVVRHEGNEWVTRDETEDDEIEAPSEDE